jgi:hypothetical protein
MVTVHKTVAAIVERSLPVCVPLEGGLTLLPGADGRYRLAEDHLDDHTIYRVRVRPRTPDGRNLPVGHVLSAEEAECAVRSLLGLDEPTY